MIICPQAGATGARPDVRLQNLRVQRRALCEVSRPTGERESLIGTVVTCQAESPDLRHFFLDLFDQALTTLGRSPTEEAVDRWIDQAVQLFSELELSVNREIRGLWGELLVICEARDPGVLVRRWHDSPDERYDFAAGSLALEVKTCSDLERVHQFSLAQIRPAATIEVVVASVPVHADPHGVSVMDLLSEVEDRIADGPTRDKLRQTVFRSGGAALAQHPLRFDRRAAVEGLRLMRASSIPAIEERLPTEVLDVHLTVRCRDVNGEDLGVYIQERFQA